MYKVSSAQEPATESLDIVRLTPEEWTTGPQSGLQTGADLDPDVLVSLFLLPFTPIPERHALREAVNAGALFELLTSRTESQCRTAARLMGLSFRPDVRDAWTECCTDLGCQPPEGVPVLFRDDAVYTPRVVWLARNNQQELPSMRRLSFVLARFRQGLLETPTAAEVLQRYFSRPVLDDPQAAVLGMVMDGERLPPVPLAVPVLIGLLEKVREANPDTVKEFFADQAEVWREFYGACRQLRILARRATDTNASVRPDDYLGSNRALRSHLEPLAEAYSVISRYERFWNVDKNLAPAGLQEDFNVLHRLLKAVRTETYRRTESFRDVYQRQWGLGLLKRAVFSMLDVTPLDVPIDGLRTDQQRVLIFLVDGLGYAQYLWWRATTPNQTRRSYGTNLFNLLAGRPEFADGSLVAANFSSDTGSGLTALFTGTLPAENGILATQMYLHDWPFRERNHGVMEDPAAVLVPGVHSWVDDLPGDIAVRALHGGSRNPSSFSRLLYGRAAFEGLDNPERCGPRILEALEAAGASRSVTIVYNPLIDRTGHSVGSFSMYEQNELQRLNTMLLSVLAELAQERPDVYDGRTTVLLTADHGMYESTDRFLTRQQLLQALQSAGVYNCHIHITNRALWLFSPNCAKAVSCLDPLLTQAGMAFEAHFRGEPLYTDLLGQSKYAPDAVICLTGEGTFTPFLAKRSDVLLYGVHGGRAVEEVFVPLISLCLTPDLLREMNDLYGRR